VQYCPQLQHQSGNDFPAQGMTGKQAVWKIAVALVLAIVVLALIAWFFLGPADAKIFFDGMFGGIVGGLITAVVTLALIWLGIEQLQGLGDTARKQAETAAATARTSDADFILRRADQFFRSETRRLYHLIEDAYLLFQEKKPLRDSYFSLDEQKISGLHDDLKKTLLDKRIYSTYEIDDLILGPLEDLATLEANGIVTFTLIYHFFGWYICRTWENGEIRRYVHAARTEREGAGDIYEGLQSLAERCEKQERSA
jgi:uncharacterized membrane protein